MFIVTSQDSNFYIYKYVYMLLRKMLSTASKTTLVPHESYHRGDVIASSFARIRESGESCRASETIAKYSIYQII